MAVTAFVYGQALKNISGAAYLADTMYGALVLATYTPNQDTHTMWSDVVANEVANGGGYTTNGILLTTKTCTEAAKVLTFKADNLTWAASTITARYAVIYDRTPATDATRPLLCWVDFGANVTSTNGNFTVTWNASGILTVTVS